MFNDLKRKIIYITMAISTIVIVLAFSLVFFVMCISMEHKREIPAEFIGDESMTKVFNEEIRQEKNFHLAKLGVSLIGVGASIEILVFVVVYLAADKMVRPVQNAYEQQRDFIANASHELKTPIAALQANFEALGVDEEPWTSNIELELDKANGLVRDLLALACLDGGTAKSEKKRVILTELVEKYAKSIEPRLGKKELILNIKDEIAEKIVRDDFIQIMNILLDNSVKYSKSWVKVELMDSELIVSNDGKRIPEEKIGHIFERFYQVDKTANGSGLGLAIAKAAADKNGWVIEVESDAKATSFKLDFKSKTYSKRK